MSDKHEFKQDGFLIERAALVEPAIEMLREFNNRLIEDEDFRKRFAENPKEAVEREQYPIPPEYLPDTFPNLPTPEELKKAASARASANIGGILW
jgi:hypothetical protein